MHNVKPTRGSESLKQTGPIAADGAAVVTGGSRGIGKGIATALAAAGARVALTYNQNHAAAHETAEEIRAFAGEVLITQMTVQDRESVRLAFREVRERIGPIGVLVNNAAMAQEKPFETITDADWDEMLAVNLRGPFVCSQEVMPDMLKQGWGRIINITSIGGQWGGFNQVHYAASKAGLISLTRSLARIYSSQGVTTNAIAPGLVTTEMSANELASETGRAKVIAIPAGRVAVVDEIAQVALFLASDASGYITGQTINVNGGMYFG